MGSVVKAAAAAKTAVAVVVADNGSHDQSEAVVKQFKDVEWLPFERNYGFGEGNNKAVKETKADAIILLNNDIKPHQDFIDPLLEAMQGDNIFAASARQKVETKAGDYFAGGNVGEWQRGLMRHRPVEELYPPLTKNTPTFYAEGGASAFDRSKFVELGGFSPLFRPFYWEDADLSFRAWKKGWTSLFVPQSEVVHRHESTISKVVPKWKKEAIGWRGIWLFTWRAIDSPSLFLSHLLWLPFHIVYGIFSGQWWRLYGLVLALPKMGSRLPHSDYHYTTEQIIKLARPH